MENPLTGQLIPFTYDVEIYHGKNIVTIITVRTTNEEEAVAQAVKQLKTVVRKK
jgi:hypothetical protein